MTTQASFSTSIYADEERLAERELSAFVRAVTELYGPHEAVVASQEWLDESELMDAAPRSECRDWRSVTIAASARLAVHINAVSPDRLPAATPGDTKVSSIPSSNIAVLKLVV